MSRRCGTTGEWWQLGGAECGFNVLIWGQACQDAAVGCVDVRFRFDEVMKVLLTARE
jgi:hypothetical protein